MQKLKPARDWAGGVVQAGSPSGVLGRGRHRNSARTTTPALSSISLPVLRLKFTLVAVKLRRHAALFLFVAPPAVLGLVELSALPALVKAYLRLFVQDRRVRIGINGRLAGARRALLLLHQLQHHQARELLCNEKKRRHVNKGKSHVNENLKRLKVLND